MSQDVGDTWSSVICAAYHQSPLPAGDNFYHALYRDKTDASGSASIRTASDKALAIHVGISMGLPSVTPVLAASETCIRLRVVAGEIVSLVSVICPTLGTEYHVQLTALAAVEGHTSDLLLDQSIAKTVAPFYLQGVMHVVRLTFKGPLSIQIAYIESRTASSRHAPAYPVATTETDPVRLLADAIRDCVVGTTPNAIYREPITMSRDTYLSLLNSPVSLPQVVLGLLGRSERSVISGGSTKSLMSGIKLWRQYHPNESLRPPYMTVSPTADGDPSVPEEWAARAYYCLGPASCYYTPPACVGHKAVRLFVSDFDIQGDAVPGEQERSGQTVSLDPLPALSASIATLTGQNSDSFPPRLPSDIKGDPLDPAETRLPQGVNVFDLLLDRATRQPYEDCCSASLFRLRDPTSWLNDEVIMGYVRTLSNASNIIFGIKVGFVDSQFWDSPTMQKILEMGTSHAGPSVGGDGGVKWQSALRKMDIPNNRLTLLPLNRLNWHWEGAAIDPVSRTVWFYDSMGWDQVSKSGVTSKIACVVCQALALVPIELDGQTVNERLHGWSFKEIATPSYQNNSYDCGVYLCLFLSWIVRQVAYEPNEWQLMDLPLMYTHLDGENSVTVTAREHIAAVLACAPRFK